MTEEVVLPYTNEKSSESGSGLACRLGTDPCIPSALALIVSPIAMTSRPSSSQHLANNKSTLTIPRRPTAAGQTAPLDHANMADSPVFPAPTDESPAQQKARLRRERLAAKSGASRLQQISALQGGPPKDLSEIQKDIPGMCG